jgi:hypothetical protein
VLQGLVLDGRLVVVADPELVGLLEQQPDVALGAEVLEVPAREARLLEVAVESGAGQRPRRYELSPHQQVDDGLGGARRHLFARLNGGLQDLGRDLARDTPVGADLRRQPQQPLLPVGAPPRPERPLGEATQLPPRRLERARGEIPDPGRELRASALFPVDLLQDVLAEDRDLASSVVDLVVEADARRYAPGGPRRSI